MNDRHIKASSVSISTVSVTIQTMKINDRQMTQAVFNQLQRLDNFVRSTDETDELSSYELAGNLWGWVNYCPKDGSAWMRQFVIESEGVLYRAASTLAPISLHDRQSYDPETGSYIEELGDKLAELTLAIYAQAIKEKRDEPPALNGVLDLGHFPYFGTIRIEDHTYEGLRIWADPDLDIYNRRGSNKIGFLGDRLHYCGVVHHRNRESRPWHENAEWYLEHIGNVDESEARLLAERQAELVGHHINETNKIRGIIRDCDQLFIAV